MMARPEGGDDAIMVRQSEGGDRSISNFEPKPSQKFEEVSAAVIAYILDDGGDIVEKIIKNKEAKSSVSIMALTGQTHRKLQAARLVMGDKLDMDKFAPFRKGIEEAEKGNKEVRTRQTALFKKARNIIDDIPYDLTCLQKKVKSELDKRSGICGLRRNQVSKEGVLAASPNELKDILEPLLTEEAEVSDDAENAETLHEKAHGLFTTALSKAIGELDVNAYTDRLDRANAHAQDSVRAREHAEGRYSRAAAKLAQEDAILVEYEKANALNMSVAQMYEDHRRQLQEELQGSESRRRNYTYNGWGRFFGMWENDIKLSEREVDMKKREIQDVDDKIVQLKKREAEAATEGQFAHVKASRKIASQEVKMAAEKLDEARHQEETSARSVQEVISAIAKEAEKNGVMDLNQVNMVKCMAASIQTDLAIMDNIRKSQKTSPFASLGKVAKRYLQEYRNNKGLHQQVDVLNDLVNVFSVQHGGSEDTQAILALYGHADRGRFFRFGTAGLSEQSMATGQKLVEDAKRQRDGPTAAGTFPIENV